MSEEFELGEIVNKNTNEQKFSLEALEDVLEALKIAGATFTLKEFIQAIRKEALLEAAKFVESGDLGDGTFLVVDLHKNSATHTESEFSVLLKLKAQGIRELINKEEYPDV